MDKTKIILGLLIIVVAGGAFFEGMKYQESKSPNQSTGNTVGRTGSGQFGQRNGTGNRAGGRATAGEIINADDKSITVKMADGSSKIVLMNDKTQINKATTATKSDLTTGTRVAVFGSDNTDGSVTAQNIQLNPQFGGGEQRTPNQAQKSADAKEIIVNGSNYKFTPDKITVKKGEKTRIVFKNTGGMHDFRVDELNIATAVIQTDKEDFVEFTPTKTGTYEFYCSVGNHRAMGMKGTIIVE